MAFEPTVLAHKAKPSGPGKDRSEMHLSTMLWIATMTLSTICSIALISHPLPTAQQRDAGSISAR